MNIELLNIKDCDSRLGPIICFDIQVIVGGFSIKRHVQSTENISDVIRDIDTSMYNNVGKHISEYDVKEIIESIKNNKQHTDASLRLMERVDKHIDLNIKNVIVSRPPDFTVDIVFLRFESMGWKTVIYYEYNGIEYKLEFILNTFLKNQMQSFDLVLDRIVLTLNVPMFRVIKYSDRTYKSFFRNFKQFVSDKSFRLNANKAYNTILPDDAMNRIYKIRKITW